MKKTTINDTGARGWFVGCFPEAVIESNEVEVCYTVEPIGKNKAHYHTKCKELIFIISGRALCHGQELNSGDIIVFEPGEINSLDVLEVSQVVSVKVPAGGNDKVYV